jgi:hypothetical protein
MTDLEIAMTDEQLATRAPEPKPLAKMDVLALRNADDVCFDLNMEGGKTTLSRIRAIKRRQNSEDGFDQTVEIETQGWVIDHQRDKDERPPAFAFYMTSRYDRVWTTIANLLREGDEITTVWVRANNSRTIDEVHLYQDMVNLEVKRYPRSGEPTVMSFGLGNSICKDNSARMIRSSRWGG